MKENRYTFQKKPTDFWIRGELVIKVEDVGFMEEISFFPIEKNAFY